MTRAAGPAVALLCVVKVVGEECAERCVAHVDDQRRGQSVGERYEEDRPERTSAGRLPHAGTHGKVEH